jgi:hypothetical protein
LEMSLFFIFNKTTSFIYLTLRIILYLESIYFPPMLLPPFKSKLLINGISYLIFLPSSKLPCVCYSLRWLPRHLV